MSCCQNIRIIDISPPTRSDLTTGSAKNIHFIQVDVTNAASLSEAFLAPWTTSASPLPGLTVFHTAANIRFYERHPALFPRSARVNALGTQNVVDAAIKAGAGVLVYTSSASVQVRSQRFLLWPWERAPKKYVQIYRDGLEEEQDLGKGVVGAGASKRGNRDYFSNYAVSKAQGENTVRRANGTKTDVGGESVLKTGCIRPANGVYGPGDILADAYISRGTNPTWVSDIVQSHVYVKNAVHAHLCYEARLLASSSSPASSLLGSSLTSSASTSSTLSPSPNVNPDVGGQAFTITDPNPPLSGGDVYTILSSLSSTTFPTISPTVMLLVAHIIERIYLTRELFLLSPFPLRRAIGSYVPAVTGDIVNLQPSLFNLAQVHLVWDPSSARARDALGYAPKYTSLRGLVETVRAHHLGEADTKRARSKLGGGITLNFGWGKWGREADAETGGLVGAERGVEDILEKVEKIAAL